MKISCPLCATSIEVSTFLVGQKGRCPNCASKFLIPESEDSDIEILERGEIPKNAPEPVPAPPSKPEPKPEPKPEKGRASSPPKVSAAPAAAPRLMPATGGAPARSAARPVIVKQSSGAFGFLFAIVLAALVGVVVYVMMERKKAQEAAATPKEPKVIKIVQQPAPPRAPVEPMVEPDEPEEPEGIPVYAKVIRPVLEAKCVGCHGEEKRKGRLALHTFEALAAGGGNGPITEPDADDPNRIELVFRAELPEDDDEHMPPQGKPQLTPEELTILKWWIGAGAHEDIESSEAPAPIRESIESLAKL